MQSKLQVLNGTRSTPSERPRRRDGTGPNRCLNRFEFIDIAVFDIPLFLYSILFGVNGMALISFYCSRVINVPHRGHLIWLHGVPR
jgi:hypothetical protein